MSVIFQSDSTRELLTKNDLADIDSVFSRGDITYDRHDTRCVKKIRIQDQDDNPCTLYVKLFWGRRRIWPRMTDIKTGQLFQSLAEREWNGLKTVSELGLNAAERLAYFHEGNLQHRAAVIVKEVPTPLSLHDIIKDGTWNSFTRVQKSLLVDKILDVIQTIHANGYAWRSSASNHFYPVWNEQKHWDVWLIDCEGIHKATSPKFFQKNYDKLLKSLRNSGVEKEILKEIRFKSGFLQDQLKKAG